MSWRRAAGAFRCPSSFVILRLADPLGASSFAGGRRPPSDLSVAVSVPLLIPAPPPLSPLYIAPPIPPHRASPPFGGSVSVTYSARRSDPGRGSVTRLVTDVVLDRLVGNTGGLSGLPGMAIACGAELDDLWDVGVPPLTLLERFLSRPVAIRKKKDPEIERRDRIERERIERIERRRRMGLKSAGLDGGGGGGGPGDDTFAARRRTLPPPPFPEEIMAKLAMGVLASELGRR